MQARAYLKFTDWAVDKQVLYLTSCLRGGPAKWIEPHLKDYLDNPRSADWKPKTRELFHSLSNFWGELNKLYRGIDQQKEAERQIHALKQKGSVIGYTAEFEQIRARLD